ncbi:MAG: CPBP family intramembrane metalloprotease [candidate division KSB1 bacterium]|nr:CPBP family intramembrane metalloprotease [candidate division KSB1 bacterium]
MRCDKYFSPQVFRRIKPEEISTRQLLTLAYMSQIVFLICNGMLGVLFLSSFLSPVPWRQRVKLELIQRLDGWTPHGIALGLVVAVLLLIVVELVSYLTILRLGRLPGFYDYFVIERWADRWKMVPAGVLAGANEEFFFRGFLFSLLMSWWPAVPFGAAQWLWVILISIGFGWLHAYQGILAVLATSLVGVLMFVLLFATGSLVAPMVCHATYDVLALLFNADLPSTRLTRHLQRQRTSSPYEIEQP